MRPKVRGTGTTQAKESVTLKERRDGEWRAVSTSLQEVAGELGALLGMSLAQFSQVVLLPQGGFATFLRADAEDRRLLLERLFDAERFTAVERWLEEERARTRERRTVAQSGAELTLAGIVATVGADADARGEGGEGVPGRAGVPTVDDPEAGIVATVGADARDEGGKDPPGGTRVPTVDDPEAVRAWIDDRGTLLDEIRRRAAGERRVTVDALGAAEAHERETTDRAARVAERRAREARLGALAERAAAREADGRGLDRARRAEPARGPRREALTARVALRTARADLAKTHRWIDALEDDEVPATAPDRWEPARDERRRLRAALEADEERERDLPGRRRELERVRGQAVASAEQSAAARAAVTTLVETERPALEARCVQLETLAGRREDLARSADRAAARAQAAEDRDRLAVELASREAERQAAVDEHQLAVERTLAVRAARLDGMAGELAADLAPGAACPVCGATDHPRPAPPAPEGADAAAEEAAGAAEKRLLVVREEVEGRASRAGAEHVRAAERAGEDEAAALRTAAEAAERESGRAADAQRAAAGAREALVDLDRRAGAARTEAEAQATAAAEGQARARVLAEALAGAERDLGVARATHASVAARRAALDHQARALDRALALHRAAEEATREAGRCESRLADALATSGLRDEADLRDAELDEAERRSLEQRIREHDEALVAERSALADPRLAEVDPAEEPPVDAAAAATALARNAHDAAVGAESSAAARQASLAERAPTLLAELDALAPLRDEARVADELSRLTAGSSVDNRKRMRLTAYVLAARLEQVAAVASGLLERMSDGRYGLVHHDERGRGGGRAGLGLRVVDGWTGEDRDTRTLSGGESFFASLALALALAEVVTAEAGGRPLETLFIDEGFGTLDQDALEDVMAVLDRLRDSGRVVGIVSHVADLRSRIAVQLRVEKHQDGSRLRLLTAAEV